MLRPDKTDWSDWRLVPLALTPSGRLPGPCNEIVTSCDRMVTSLSYGVTQRVVY